MSYDQTNQDQLYIEDGYFTPDGYYVYIAEAKVDLTPYIDEGYIEANYYEYYGGAGTFTCDFDVVAGGQIEEANADLTATASISAQIAITKVADSAISAVASQTATIFRIQEGASTVSAQASQSTVAVKTVSADINAGALFTPNITVEAVKNMTAVIDCVATISADTQATKVFNITLSTIVTQSLQGVYTADAHASIASAFSSTANIDVVKEYSSNQSSAFTQTVSIDKLKRATASLTSTASITTSKYFGSGRPRNIYEGATTFNSSIKKFGSHSLQSPTWARSEPLINGTSTVRPKSTQPFVMEAWIYLTSYGTGLNDGFGVGLNRLNSDSWIRITTNGTLEFSSGVTDAGSPPATAANAVALNSWHHILVVANPYTGNNNDVSVYVNGTRVAQHRRAAPNFTQLADYFSIRTGITYIDDVSFHVGSTLGYNPSSTTITVPTSARENDFDYTRLLWHMDNNGLDDVSILVKSTANITSNCSVSVNARASKVGTLALGSAFTQTASATKAVEAQINLSAVFSQTASAEDIDLAEIALSATFTLQAQVDDLDVAAANLTSEFALTVSTDKLKGAVINAGAMFTPTIDCQATRVGDIDLIAQTTLIATPNYTVAGNINLTAQTQLSSNSGYLIKNATQTIRSRSKMRMEGFTWYNQPVTPPDLTPRPRNLSGTATFTTGKYSQGLLLDNSPQVTRQDSEFNYSQWGRIDLWYSPGNGIDTTGFGQTILEYSDGSTVSWRLKTVQISSTDYRFRFEWFQSNGTFRTLTSSNVIWTSSSDNTFKRFYIQKLDSTATISNNVSISDITGNIYITTDAPRYLANATLKFGGADRIDRIDELIFFKDNVKDALPNNVLSDNPFKLSSQTNVIALYHFDGNLIDDTGIINVAEMSVDSGTLLEIAEIQYLYTLRANLQSTALQVTNARKQIGVISNNSSQFNLTGDVKRTRTVDSAMSSVSSMSCSISRIRYADSQLSSNLTLTAQAYDFTKGSADFNVVVTQTTQAYDFTKTGAELFVDCLVTPNVTRIFQLESQFDAIASNITAAAKTGQGLVTVEVVANLTASAIKNAVLAENLLAIAQISAEARSLVVAEANLNTTATQTTDATKFRPAQANVTSSFAINIDAVKTTDVTSNNSAEFTQTTVNDRLRDNTVTASSAFTQNTEGLRVKIFTVFVNSNSEILATAFTLVQYQANIASNGFVLAAGDVEHIDPYYTYMIEQETRAFQIDEEPRLYTIDPETRVNIIKGSLL